MHPDFIVPLLMHTTLYFQCFHTVFESCPWLGRLLNFPLCSYLSETSEPLIAWFSHSSPPSSQDFRDHSLMAIVQGSTKKREEISLLTAENPCSLSPHTDCAITCMFFHGLKARGISLVSGFYALTPIIGKTEPFLKVFDGEMLIRFEKCNRYFLQQ